MNWQSRLLRLNDVMFISIEEPIKVLGQYRVKVRVATGVEAEVKVNVEREK